MNDEADGNNGNGSPDEFLRDEFMARFAFNVDYYMKRAGVRSGTQLAKMAGIAQSTVSCFMRGEKKPGILQIAKIGRALGVEPALLMMPRAFTRASNGLAGELIDELADDPGRFSAIVGLLESSAARPPSRP